jgi:hypothetical protein
VGLGVTVPWIAQVQHNICSLVPNLSLPISAYLSEWKFNSGRMVTVPWSSSLIERFSRFDGELERAVTPSDNQILRPLNRVVAAIHPGGRLDRRGVVSRINWDRRRRLQWLWQRRRQHAAERIH